MNLLIQLLPKTKEIKKIKNNNKKKSNKKSPINYFKQKKFSELFNQNKA